MRTADERALKASQILMLNSACKSSWRHTAHGTEEEHSFLMKRNSDASSFASNKESECFTAGNQRGRSTNGHPPEARRADKTPSHVGRRGEAKKSMGLASATMHNRTSLPDCGPRRYRMVTIVQFPGPAGDQLISN